MAIWMKYNILTKSFGVGSHYLKMASLMLSTLESDVAPVFGTM